MTTLRTARLALRPPRPTDLEAAVVMGADARVMTTLGGVQTREKTSAWLDKVMNEWRTHGFGRFVVETHDGELVGYVGLTHTDFDAPPLTPSIEIAWRVVFEHWSRGYATEAARAVIDHAFGALGFRELIAITTPANARSLAVMRKLGFTPEPDATFEHPALPVGHALRLHLVHRLTYTRV